MIANYFEESFPHMKSLRPDEGRWTVSWTRESPDNLDSKLKLDLSASIFEMNSKLEKLLFDEDRLDERLPERFIVIDRKEVKKQFKKECLGADNVSLIEYSKILKRYKNRLDNRMRMTISRGLYKTTAAYILDEIDSAINALQDLKSTINNLDKQS